MLEIEAIRLLRLGDNEMCPIRCQVFDEQHQSVAARLDYEVWIGASATRVVLQAVWVGSIAPVGQINISAIRNLPLTRWEAAARALLTLIGTEHPEAIRSLGVDSYCKLSVSEDERHVDRALKNVYPDVDEDTTRGGQRRARGLRRLARTAVEYRGHLVAGRSDPAAEIARTHQVSMSTARTWIHRARGAGLLGPAAGRTPGEARAARAEQ